MNIPATSCSALSFQRLIEPQKSNYTSKQEKLASQIRDVVSLKKNDDSKRRSYLDFFEQEYKIDLVVKPAKHFDGVELNAYEQITDETDLIMSLNEENELKEYHLSNYLFDIEDDAEHFTNRFILYTLSALAISIGMFFAHRNGSDSLPKIEKGVTKELVQKAIDKANNASIPFFQKLAK